MLEHHPCFQRLPHWRVIAAVAAGAFALAVAEGAENLTLPPYRPPTVEGLHWVETFDGDVWSRWTASTKEKYNGRWRVDPRKEEALVGDLGLHCPDGAHHYGVSTDIPEVKLQEGGPALMVQFEAKHQDGLQCGGSYLKLFARAGSTKGDFDSDVPYIIMFGPDRCGGATDKVHFILRHQNPLNGSWEEKHLRDAPPAPNNRRSHLYGLVIRPDNHFEVRIDGVVKASGSLLDDDAFEPPVNPPKLVDDPEDKKPADWVDLRLIDDPEAKKPDDWGDEDEPEFLPDLYAKKPEGWREDAPWRIPDPAAARPEDWNDEEDGEWEPRLIDNPACKVGCGPWDPPGIENPKFVGRWEPPLVDNPDYKGQWFPRKIDNPHYYFDAQPALFPAFDAVGFDLWTMQGGLYFDNIVIVLGNLSLAEAFANQTFFIRKPIEEIQDPPEPEPPESWFGEGGLIGWMDRNPIVAAITSWVILIVLLFWCMCPGVCVHLFCRGRRPDEGGDQNDDTAPADAQEPPDAGGGAAKEEPKPGREKKDD